eukprot:gene2181-17772_t
MASFMDRNPRKVKEMLASFLHTPERSNEEKNNSIFYFATLTKFLKPSTWTAKPVELSPLHCSRYGWMNGDNDELVCVTCKAALNAGLPDNWDNETCELL